MKVKLSRIQSVSNFAIQKKKPSRAKMTTQTSATFSRKGIRALVTASRSKRSPIASLLNGEIGPVVPLLGELRQGAVLVHVADDAIDGLDETGVVHRRALVEGGRPRLVEDRVTDDLDRLATVDEALGSGQRGDHGIQPGAVAERQVLERGRVGVVAVDIGVVDDVVERVALDVHVLVQELLVGA